MTDPADAPTREPRTLEFAVLGLVVASGALRAWLAARYYGFLSGDDLEVVQAAAKYALGLDYQPWSLRCLFHPLVIVAPVLRIAALFGAADDPLAVAWWASLPGILASSATVWLTFRLGIRLGLDRMAGALAAFFYALHWLPLGYGSTQVPRPVSTMLFVLALLLAMGSITRGVLCGGLLIGAAFAVRFSEGMLMLPFLVMVWWRHRKASALAAAAAGGLVGALVFAGVTDWLTWGRPFASLVEFVRIMGGPHRPDFPRYDKPWFWYGSSMLQWAGPAAIVLAFVGLRLAKAQIPLLLFALVVVGNSFFAYKAYRYLQAAVPLLALVMGIACMHLLGAGGWRRAAGSVLLAVASLWGIERTLSLMRDKSRAAMDAALWMKRFEPRRVVLEQEWAYGGRLTYGNGVEIRAIEPERPIGLAGPVLAGTDAAAFYERDLGDPDREVLRTAGFRQVFRVESPAKTVVVFSRSP